MSQVVLYGLAGAELQYRALRYEVLEDSPLSIGDLIYEASSMMAKNPSIDTVYAIDNRRGLGRDFNESIKKNTIESCAVFKDILEREGIVVMN